jgi:TonB family protein
MKFINGKNEKNRFFVSLIFSVFLNFLFFLILVKSFLPSVKSVNLLQNISVDISKNFKQPQLKSKSKTFQKLKTSKNIQNIQNNQSVLTENILAIEDTGSVSENFENNFVDSYLAEVNQKIEQNKYYPKIDRKLNHEGLVTVEFTIKKNGRVADLRILKKSEYPSLNNSAIKTVMLCSPFDSFPINSTEEKIKVEVNITYNLK